MTSFSERLIYLIKEFGVSHTTIFEKTGISTGNLSSYRSGRVKPSFDAIVALANFFNISTDWLLKGSGPIPVNIPQERLPLYSCTDSETRLLNENLTHYLTQAFDDGSVDFSCSVKDDRMQYTGINDGDTAFCKRADTAQPGQIVAVRYLTGDNELTLQFFILKDGQPYFCSANPDYEDVRMTANHQIVGVLTGLLKVQSPAFSDYEKLLSKIQRPDKVWAEIIASTDKNGIPVQFVEQLIKAQIALVQHISKSNCKK